MNYSPKQSTQIILLQALLHLQRENVQQKFYCLTVLQVTALTAVGKVSLQPTHLIPSVFSITTFCFLTFFSLLCMMFYGLLVIHPMHTLLWIHLGLAYVVFFFCFPYYLFSTKPQKVTKIIPYCSVIWLVCWWAWATLITFLGFDPCLTLFVILSPLHLRHAKTYSSDF